MRVAVLTAMSLLTASASLAQETPADPEVTRLNAQAARDNAAAAATTAQTARLKAQIDALGLPTADGKATIGSNGGTIEAWMLSASTADAAAAQIARDVATALSSAGPRAPLPVPRLSAQGSRDVAGRTTAGGNGRSSTASGNPNTASRGANPNIVNQPVTDGRANAPGDVANAAGPQPASARDEDVRRPPVLLVGGDEELVLDQADSLQGEIGRADDAIRRASPAFCSQPTVASSNNGAGGVIPIAAVGALVGLLKTDTEISGVDVPVANRMLMAAVGRRLVLAGMPVTLPTAAIAPVSGSAIAQDWGVMTADREDLRACRARFAAKGKTGWYKTKLDAMDAAIKTADELEMRVTKADDHGRIPLAQAIRVETLLRGDPDVLRVSVEKGGGSLLKRSNIWTALGAPAIGITGGLIVSYVLTDPRTGALVQSGALVCRTALTDLRAVQAGRVARDRRSGADCAPLMPVSEGDAARNGG